MPSVELSKLQATTAARALSPGDSTAPAPTPARARNAAAGGDASGVSVELGARAAGASGSGLEPAGAPPVDRERVAEIRKALEEGRYPLVPTRIADAMIAARVSLGMEK